MNIKKAYFTLVVAVFYGLAVPSARAQYGGHGGHSGHGGHNEIAGPNPRDEARERAEAVKARQARLEKLQDKIDAVEKKLEDSNLAVKKRMKLETKLKKLYTKKDKLLED